MEGLSDSVQIETLIANLLKEMGRENGLGNTPRGNEPAKLAVTERPGGKICSPMVRKYNQGNTSKVGKPAIPTRLDHCVG